MNRKRRAASALWLILAAHTRNEKSALLQYTYGREREEVSGCSRNQIVALEGMLHIGSV
jgi:hypothetical protein